MSVQSEALTRAKEEIKRFFDRDRMKDVHVFCGIDPGAQGAIGLLSGKFGTAFDIPTITLQRAGKTKAGNKKTKIVFDHQAICQLFDLIDDMAEERGCSIGVCLEEAQILVKRGFGGKKGGDGEGGSGAYGAYKVGIAFGMWPLFLADRGYPHLIVPPVTWKKAMGLTGKDKAFSRAMATSRWPMAPLSRVKDHDRAEALLLASYYRKQEVSDG